MNTFRQDLRYAVRSLSKSPGFTAVAVATLALAIGANTAIFSLVRGVLLRPLPFPEADRVMAVEERNSSKGDVTVSAPNFLDWQSQNRVFSAMGAYYTMNLAFADGSEPERLRATGATPGFFPALGVRPALGRTFSEAETVRGAQPRGRPFGRPVAASVSLGPRRRRQADPARRRELHRRRRHALGLPLPRRGSRPLDPRGLRTERRLPARRPLPGRCRAARARRFARPRSDGDGDDRGAARAAVSEHEQGLRRLRASAPAQARRRRPTPALDPARRRGDGHADRLRQRGGPAPLARHAPANGARGANGSGRAAIAARPSTPDGERGARRGRRRARPAARVRRDRPRRLGRPEPAAPLPRLPRPRRPGVHLRPDAPDRLPVRARTGARDVAARAGVGAVGRARGRLGPEGPGAPPRVRRRRSGPGARAPDRRGPALEEPPETLRRRSGLRTRAGPDLRSLAAGGPLSERGRDRRLHRHADGEPLDAPGSPLDRQSSSGCR